MGKEKRGGIGVARGRGGGREEEKGKGEWIRREPEIKDVPGKKRMVRVKGSRGSDAGRERGGKEGEEGE